jgi:hypothetical protein
MSKNKDIVILNWDRELAGEFSISIQHWEPYDHNLFGKHSVEDIFFCCNDM